MKFHKPRVCGGEVVEVRAQTPDDTFAISTCKGCGQWWAEYRGEPIDDGFGRVTAADYDRIAAWMQNEGRPDVADEIRRMAADG